MKQFVVLVVTMLLMNACTLNESTNETLNGELNTVPTIMEKDKFGISQNQAFLDKFRLVQVDTLLFNPVSYGEAAIGPKITQEEFDYCHRVLRLILLGVL
ncbi:MAG: hypothetical protein Q4F57_00740 [Weeksellaceae bacterium]|nr:hypothetical protein [Weeksellaceae bacterium]